jgi:hypothetical protein
MPFVQQWEVLFVALLGAFTGAAELIGRYRDAPSRALRTGGALVYIIVNLVAAIAALFLIQKIGVIQETDVSKRAIYEVLIAGVGSIVFLRSSLFKATINEAEVSIGPAFLLDILLTAADQSVAQRRAEQRTTDAAEVMRDVSFDKAFVVLPTLCIGLMRTVSEADQASISRQVALIQANPAVTPHARSLLLGALLMSFFGLDMLREAIKQLAPDIKYDVPQPRRSIEPSVLTQMLDEIKLGAGDDPTRPR